MPREKFTDELHEARKKLRVLNLVSCISMLFFAMLINALFFSAQTLVPVIGLGAMLALHVLVFILEYTESIGIKLGANIRPVIYFIPTMAVVLLTGGFRSPFIHFFWSVFISSFATVPAMDMIIPPTVLLQFTAPFIIMATPKRILETISFRHQYSESEYILISSLVFLVVTMGGVLKQVILRTMTAGVFEREKKSSQAKSRFLATVSHEIRTPLTTILGWVELLLSTSLPPDVSAKLNIIQSSGNHLLSVINDLLDYSKVETHKLELEKRVFHLEDTIRAALNTTRILLKPGVELRVNMDLGLVQCVVGDPHRLTQIIINLVSNAIKFTSEGSITFSCRKGRKSQAPRMVEILFSVSDTGIGMDTNSSSRLFQPFFQVDSSMSRRYGGTGLGLSIAKQFIELMHGSIRAESKLSHGTTFTWNVWFDNDVIYDDEFISESPSQPSSLRGSNDEGSCLTDSPRISDDIVPADVHREKIYKVLLVEDNELNRRIISSMLCKLRLEVDTADNGAVALEKVHDHLYDIILMDFQMPLIDGVEATRLLRQRGCRTPVVGITANADEMSRTEAANAGMCQFVTKPMRMIDLEYAIESALRLKSNTLRQRITANP